MTSASMLWRRSRKNRCSVSAGALYTRTSGPKDSIAVAEWKSCRRYEYSYTGRAGQLRSIDEVSDEADKNSAAEPTARLLTDTSKVFSMQHKRV